MASTQLGRWWLYLSEMYPPAIRLTMAGVLFLGPYFALTLLAPGASPGASLELSPLALAGWITYFLFLLLLRIADEFKDYELDCRLFPERPLPSGRVLKPDLLTLAALALALILALNTVVAPFTIGFAIMIFYGFLMWQFFFIKERIQKSLVLALVTHNPIMFLMTIYTSSLVAFEQQTSIASLDFIRLGILFALPGLIWELSRKIKAPQDENEYETYSQVFGHRIAAMLPAGLYLVHGSIVFSLADELQLSKVYLGLLLAGIVIACLFSIRFVLNPNQSTAKLRPAAEAYATLASLGFIVDLIISRGLTWKL
jgi:4-hydroxybenzoate polyprenyltransferase